MDTIPIWALLAATVGMVIVAVECGLRLGRRVQRRPNKEKPSPVSSIVASTLGLLAFMLAFTFGTVTSRYDARTALVRDEANVLREVWLRADFLPEPGRSETRALLETYLNQRLALIGSHTANAVAQSITEANRIQHRLWEIAVAPSRKDIHSPVPSIYIGSLNQLIDLHTLRVVYGLESRVPTGIWLTLYSLIFLGMVGVGFQTAIAEATGRTWAPLILALSFSIVIALIASLDRPVAVFMTVSQRPMAEVRAWIDSRPGDLDPAVKP